ncbi:allergen Asp f 7 homolog [Zingiber officinale]|uniref:allergen Asp f 7 homolog n=1 Tax=Zingiber officinale TaxID=94328 RepID=UPI001C4CFDE7|nr:allergen Asp f 7 homolog [Zingiber officinale]
MRFVLWLNAANKNKGRSFFLPPELTVASLYTQSSSLAGSLHAHSGSPPAASTRRATLLRQPPHAQQLPRRQTPRAQRLTAGSLYTQSSPPPTTSTRTAAPSLADSTRTAAPPPAASTSTAAPPQAASVRCSHHLLAVLVPTLPRFRFVLLWYADPCVDPI